jgi:hypothetical protein
MTEACYVAMQFNYIHSEIDLFSKLMQLFHTALANYHRI